MPVVPTTPYDTIGYVLERARALVNDAAQTIDGNLLASDQPYTWPFANAAYRDLQDELVEAGFEALVKEAEMLQLEPSGVSLPPDAQAYVDFTGYNDGNVMHANPVLPVDMVTPLRLWERQTGSSDVYAPVLPVNDGLPSGPVNGARFRFWDWRQDRIYLLPSNQTNDLRLRYLAYLPDFATPQAALPAGNPSTLTITDAEAQLVMILRSTEALANFIAYEYAHARGSPQAADFQTEAMRSVAKMTARTARKKQRGSHRRIAYGDAVSW